MKKDYKCVKDIEQFQRAKIYFLVKDNFLVSTGFVIGDEILMLDRIVKIKDILKKYRVYGPISDPKSLLHKVSDLEIDEYYLLKDKITRVKTIAVYKKAYFVLGKQRRLSVCIAFQNNMIYGPVPKPRLLYDGFIICDDLAGFFITSLRNKACFFIKNLLTNKQNLYNTLYY